MPAPLGNRFWEARTTHGRDKIFSTPDVLWAACVEYFEWTEENPLTEEKVFCAQGLVTRATVSRMRAMTLSGLYRFLDISRSTWDEYRGREDFSAVIEQVEETIKDQKFSGAAADLLNANIIARDLGLRDKQDHELSGNKDNPVRTSMMVQFVNGPDDS